LRWEDGRCGRRGSSEILNLKSVNRGLACLLRIVRVQ
jgi:hypothetical protein